MDKINLYSLLHNIVNNEEPKIRLQTLLSILTLYDLHSKLYHLKILLRTGEMGQPLKARLATKNVKILLSSYMGFSLWL